MACCIELSEHAFALSSGNEFKTRTSRKILIRLKLVAVEVRCQTRRNAYRIGLKESGETGYRDMTRRRLDGRLPELERERPDKLYVKIIMPPNSGLPYTQVWAVTEHVLESYAYHFQ